LVVAFVGLILYGSSTPTLASHHDNDGDSGHTLLFYQDNEMNARTSQGLAISVYPGYLPISWQSPLQFAWGGWNSALAPTTGFNVFVQQPGAVLVHAGNDPNVCGVLSGGGFAHACPFQDFNYQAPSGGIYGYTGAVSGVAHIQSDLMHELGHVLYNAAEHYTGANGGFNCSSIMGHCNAPTITTVQGHDITDFANAYRMKDAPDAAYAQRINNTTVRHFFEGSYFGGSGLTLHAEKRYVFDRATDGVSGTYTYDQETGRRIDNTNDGTPNSVDFATMSDVNQEYCFKARGETGAIANVAQSYRWSPQSRPYCIARSGAGSGVTVFSNRNNYVTFVVYNNSGNSINNVALLLDGTTTRICDFGSISNLSSAYCFATGLGSGAGFLDVWYNLVERDTIGYGAQ